LNSSNRFFITGGSGFIGSHLHQVLNQSDIINFDLNPPSFKSNSTFFRGDVCRYEDIDNALQLHPCNTIIHLSAKHGDFGISESEYFRVNVEGIKQLMKAAKKHSIKKIIFLSSVAIYGNNTKPSNECTTPNPINPYGVSKLAAEKILTEWYNEDTSRCALIIRPAYVYGEGNRANMFRLLQMIESNKYVQISYKKVIKSVAYVKNLTDAIVFLTNHINQGLEIYNYSDNPQMTSFEIAQLLSKYLGKKNIKTLPYFLVYPIALFFDFISWLTRHDYQINSKRLKKFLTSSHFSTSLNEKLGFKARFDNEEGLKKMVEWYKNLEKSKNVSVNKTV
jgi:GlcNAc-P-P-Und epimerase